MKTRLRDIGIDLIPETPEENEMTKRLFKGGAFAGGYGTSGRLTITFADLIEKPVSDTQMRSALKAAKVEIVSYEDINLRKLQHSEIEKIIDIRNQIDDALEEPVPQISPKLSEALRAAQHYFLTLPDGAHRGVLDQIRDALKEYPAPVPPLTETKEKGTGDNRSVDQKTIIGFEKEVELRNALVAAKQQIVEFVPHNKGRGIVLAQIDKAVFQEPITLFEARAAVKEIDNATGRIADTPQLQQMILGALRDARANQAYIIDHYDQYRQCGEMGETIEDFRRNIQRIDEIIKVKFAGIREIPAEEGGKIGSNTLSNIDDLRGGLEKLLSLLDDPQPGLYTWMGFYERAVKNLLDFFGVPKAEVAPAAETFRQDKIDEMLKAVYSYLGSTLPPHEFSDAQIAIAEWTAKAIEGGSDKMNALRAAYHYVMCITFFHAHQQMPELTQKPAILTQIEEALNERASCKECDVWKQVIQSNHMVIADHDSQIRKMRAALENARLLLANTMSDPENSLTIKQIDDALKEPVCEPAAQVAQVLDILDVKRILDREFGQPYEIKRAERFDILGKWSVIIHSRENGVLEVIGCYIDIEGGELTIISGDKIGKNKGSNIGILNPGNTAVCMECGNDIIKRISGLHISAGLMVVSLECGHSFMVQINRKPK